ncbi:alpha/beta hydrolase [Nocardia rhamnosiphila]|uniref:alpha/beta hydrolase n=1 Tax=Nocardia rhamnosiphila TaxID=426716 RepID=UPI0004C32697|nr:alpha/beta hydrolase family protein [Nocardia rhamnosiphila]
MKLRVPFLAVLAVLGAVATAMPPAAADPAGNPPPAAPAPATSAEKPGGRLLRVQVLDDRRIRLHIRSAAMGREIAIDTLIGSGPAPRPTLYLLDGVDGGPTSGWLTKGGAAEFFADKPVDVVLTTGGTASMYADWIRVDAALGLNRWETFLTEELPPIVEKYLGSNGSRAIAGVSMGAQAAMMLTQRHQGFYRGVAGMSGCYSTSDQLGRAVTTMTVASRGGNPENLFGPPASPEWLAHDSLLGADTLRGTRIYVSVANGSPSNAALMSIGDSPEILAVLLGGGSLLESGAHLCTQRFATRLTELGIPAVVDYLPAGMHSWPDFEVQLHRSWPTLRAALELPQIS